MKLSIVFICIVQSFLLFANNKIFAQTDFYTLRSFTIQDTTKSYATAATPFFKDGSLYMIYPESNDITDSLFIISSTDGINWNSKKFISVINKEDGIESQLVLSSIVTSTGRIILTYTFVTSVAGQKQTFITFSDDDGLTWSFANNFKGIVYFNNPKIIQTSSGRLWTNVYTKYLFYSDDDGTTWIPQRLASSFTADDFTIVGDSTVLLLNTTDKGIELTRSNNLGSSWDDTELIYPSTQKINNLEVATNSDSAWVIFNTDEATVFPNISRTTIKYIKTDLNFGDFSDTKEFTNYIGNDCDFNSIVANGKLFISFLSDRKYGVLQNWFFHFDNIQYTTSSYPVVYKIVLSEILINTPINIEVYAYDKTNLECKLVITEGNSVKEIILTDDGAGSDIKSNDNIYSSSFIFDKEETDYKLNVTIKNSNGLIQNKPLETINYSQPIGIPKTEKWLNVGSFHNWYSSIGGERELDCSESSGQLWGWQWPAFYPNQDMQAAKGLWIGCRNYNDPDADSIKFDYKVVHCGPRPLTGGNSEFFPIEFKHYAKFQPTEVTVNNMTSNYPGQKVVIDELDSSMPYDQMIYNSVNTQLGLKMNRKIYQFSNPYYDNFHVIEYTFINTGNTDADNEIERKSGDLEDVYFYFQNRMSFVRETRILFGDPTVWGANTLNNEVGPYPAGNNEDLRYSYAWHGYWDFREYNNIGGPIWHPDIGFGARINEADTVGRLGAAQFSGDLTLFAQAGTNPTVDDISQPSTTGSESSDGNLNYASDTFNQAQMQQRYNLMTKGHPVQSHADWITGGDYVNSNRIGGDQSSNSAGYSYVNGYGPYQIAYGDSVKIIIVEGSAGLSRDEAIRIGKLFKSGEMTVTDKNIAVLSGQDSLHTTFKRAMDAFKNGWNVPQAPYPPKTFNVTSHHARIDLSWTPNNDGPEIKGYELYRNTLEKVDGYVSNSWFSKYELIAELSADANTFTDTTQKYSEDYYYYIVAVGDEVAANNELKIPAHKLKSNRSYTQTYLFAQKLIVSVNNKNEIPTEYKLEQNYPNPFNPTTTINYSIPKKGIVQLNVYDALGREVATLINKEQSVGNYKIDFNAASLTSGIYFYRLQSGSFTQTKKLILLR